MQGARMQITRYLLALLLLSGPVLAATGPETAQLLNRRYQNTTAECAGANPAYFCSGVLMRGGDPALEFWKHGEVATQLGAEALVYLRSDLGTRTLSLANGVVFSDSFTAIGLGRSLDVLCTYPFELALDGNRPDFGCGTVTSGRDSNSCAAQGVTDAESWLTHFHQQDLQTAKQCSLSSLDPAQFKASLLAHQGIDNEWSARSMQVQLRNWDVSAPKQLPLQGLYYDMTQPAALLGAQRDQRAYFIATGDWLPIMRTDLMYGPDAVFGFDLREQVYSGYEVAARLNARYADTSMACRGNTAAYNCNGVLIRTTDASPNFHAWNPSPGSIERNGVSFSYLRADVHLPRLAWAKNEGLIMKELAFPTAYPLTLRCSFPFDGATFYRSDSCNGHSESPEKSKPCDEQGISGVDAVITHFYAQPSRYHGCSLRGTQAEFAVSVEARSRLTAADQGIHNEVIIANWPQDIPAQLPLEAFFYVAASGRPKARFFQWDYFQQTGRFLPIVQVSWNTTSSSYRFDYDPADQWLSPEQPALTRGNAR
ncbi:hypothetical protein QZR14_12135 [Pseudomonas sp. rhizo66]|uniref:hypothetical protein n=1 Tax=Pseudomonas sp. rhizo66 TaxID=3059674 RepID=UPI00288CA3AC|nr:hypothetical protein [Pseudomonas sp. rhizo66]MDT3312101.1 hypothetical protein [Pseudomonas sp. rhizo66]